MEHHFKLTGTWQGGLNGEGKIAVGNLENAISVPKDMKGPGKGTNPEELLVGAAATCYLITLAAVLERRKVTVQSLNIVTEGVVSAEGALKFTKIIHRPHLTLATGATDEMIQTAKDATDRAEKACLISNAVRGNVAVTVEATVLRA